MNEVTKHFDNVARSYDYYKNRNKFYYSNLKRLLSSLIPKNTNVFEFGCGTGDLLASLNPKIGYGFDISDNMIEISKIKYQISKNLYFSTKWPNQKFDYVFMADVIEHLDNPKRTFCKISKLMGKDTVFVNTMANPIWESILMIAEKLKLKMPEGPHARIKNEELRVILEKTGLKIIKHDYFLLVPIYIPLVANFINKYLERYLMKYAFIEYIVAKKE